MIVILTGAGISQESGLATFRASDGLWENERVEDVATPGGFARDADKVFRFYNLRRKQLAEPGIQPNPAHLALAKLENEYSGEVLVITQNVDNLHERAGSHNLLHMHGELLKARCTACDGVSVWETELDKKSVCPNCKRAGFMRPHIVWFEEMPLYMDQIEHALTVCKTFVSIGTSGNVYPAAGFASHARHNGAQVIELNLEPSKGARVFHDGRYGKASEVVPAWVEEILSSCR